MFYIVSKTWSYPTIVGVAAVVALAMLGGKFLIRIFTRPEAIVRGDEVQDTALWFVMIVVVLLLGRSALIRNNAIAEIHGNDDDQHAE